MKTFASKLFFSSCFLACSVLVQAQFSSSNGFGIFPTTQVSFNPNGKFTAIGESGGVPGQTAAGCDLYGFRAQFNPDIAVSLGIRTFQFPFPFGGSFTFRGPALTASASGLVITQQNGNNTGACGDALATFDLNASTGNVLTIFGSATASGGSWTTSDRRLKRNIETIQNPMDIINGLTGYTYEYRTDELPNLRLPNGRRYGFITQEVQKVMPTVVRQADGFDQDDLGFQVMEYNAIIPVLTEAIKLQQGTLTELEQQNTALEEKNAALEAKTTALEQQNTELEARLARLEALLLKDGASTTPNRMDEGSRVQLGQNSPNPTGANTTIDYSLPRDMTNAFLVVVDLNGREMLNQAIVDANGVLELNTSKWTAGTYVYSIIVDGKTLASKKMLVQ